MLSAPSRNEASYSNWDSPLDLSDLALALMLLSICGERRQVRRQVRRPVSWGKLQERKADSPCS